MPAVDRTPAVPRLCVQMRSNAAKGVPNTQERLASDLGVGVKRVRVIIAAAVERGLVARAGGLAPGRTKRGVWHYELTRNGRVYADEQLQGAGPCK